MVQFLMLARIALALLITYPALADAIGPARVIDDDTIAIGNEQIRLFGTDVPEIRHPRFIRTTVPS